MTNILLVDDEPNILKLSSFIIKALGYNVFTAEDGKKAIEYLDKHNNVDLIVSDLIMPEIGGFELCKTVREKVPVIIVSAMSNEFKVETVFDVGAIDYIGKPFDVNYVRSRIAFLLHKLGRNPEFKPEVSIKVGKDTLYKGENVLFVKRSSSEIGETEMTKMICNNTESFNLEEIVQNSESLGQTIQSRAGGLRIVENIDLEKHLDLIKTLNRTNCALGDITGLFFTPEEPSAKLKQLFDRVF